MKPEIEAKFLDMDFEAVRAKLREAGAVCVHPVRLMQRKNFDHADGRLEAIGGWIRVRDEGDKVTLAYKQLDNRDIDGTKEVSVEVSSFDDTVALLLAAGLKQTSYQETRRESWVLDGTQIELDEWPWVRPFVEIEAPDAEALYAAAEKLGFDREKALHGSVEIMYLQEYDVSEQEVDAWPEITFSPVPDWLSVKRKR
jgi:adenylate cyclase class 2